MTVAAWPGRPYPLGATVDDDGVNFALYSESAEAVELCLFDADGTETRVPLTEQTYHVWHAYLPGIRPGQRYGYRVHGPWALDRGLRHNAAKLLADPYARAFRGGVVHGPALYGDNDLDSAGSVPYSVVTAPVAPPPPGPRIPWVDTVIYELHVRGFTARHPGVPPELRGTYAGLAHPAALAHLTSLGITTVELLPVHESVTEPFVAARGLTNYWGYNTLGYFAPDQRFAATDDPVTEFRDMVAALHAAGIEVILDVVYNHSAEGDDRGPVLEFKGIDNPTYYRLEPHDRARYRDYTGTGNTLDLRQFQTLQLVMDSLRYWVTEMGVDGFRFDLASALARSLHDVDRLSAFMAVVHQDPVVSQAKLIAEPWDVGEGGYQVGEFPPLWTEWNGRYRDTVRDFWRGAPARMGELGWRLTGSADLYADDGRKPFASINFVTAHDGFTLRDLVSYERKHNVANGERNRDGTDDNRSMNFGVEGETEDLAIRAARRRQVRNLLATLVLSSGVPMITAGDEMLRTQQGNNNPYCQDNEVSYVDWTLPWDADRMLDFSRGLLRLRRESPVFRQGSFFLGEPRDAGGPRKDLGWFSPNGREMTDADWHTPDSGTIGMYLDGEQIAHPGPRGEQITDGSYLLWLHSRPADVAVILPDGVWGKRYELVFDTAHEDPFGADGGRVIDAGESLHLTGRSVVLLRVLER